MKCFLRLPPLRCFIIVVVVVVVVVDDVVVDYVDYVDVDVDVDVALLSVKVGALPGLLSLVVVVTFLSKSNHNRNKRWLGFISVLWIRIRSL